MQFRGIYFHDHAEILQNCQISLLHKVYDLFKITSYDDDDYVISAW